MPELPEVETVRRGLEPIMVGRKIAAIEVHRGGLRVPFPARLKSIEGKTVSSLSRRAKYILIRFEKSDAVLVIHLGMSGHMTVTDDLKTYVRKKHDHMVIALGNGKGIVFNDARRFGMVLLVDEGELDDHPAFKPLGPEPLSRSFAGKMLAQRLAGKKVAIKLALLDQKLVAGIGNIYACEALFSAGIDPWREAGTIGAGECDVLAKAIKDVLNRSIKAGGSTLRDYRHADGELGYFQHSFLVYDREGQPCPRCAKDGKIKGKAKDAHIVHRKTQGGRSTFYCPGCQG